MRRAMNDAARAKMFAESGLPAESIPAAVRSMVANEHVIARAQEAAFCTLCKDGLPPDGDTWSRMRALYAFKCGCDTEGCGATMLGPVCAKCQTAFERTAGDVH